MSGKRALIRGTAILTITSFVTRFMGFFYRIFLGHTFGEENVGLYLHSHHPDNTKSFQALASRSALLRCF